MQRSAPRDALLFRRDQLGTASTYVRHRYLFGRAWLLRHLIGRAIKGQDSLVLTTENRVEALDIRNADTRNFIDCLAAQMLNVIKLSKLTPIIGSHKLLKLVQSLQS